MIPSPIRRILLGALWVVVACGLWGHWFAWPPNDLRLMREGVATTGHVLETHEDLDMGDDRRLHASHAFRYAFRLPTGQEVEAETRNRNGRLPPELRASQGWPPIEVEYLPSDPSVSRILGEGAQHIGEWGCNTALALIALALLLWPGVVVVRSGVNDEIERRRIGSGGRTFNEPLPPPP